MKESSMKRVKKQYLILLAVLFALVGSMALASCAQPNTVSGGASADAEASASGDAAASADASASGDAAASAEEATSAATSADAAASASTSATASSGEFKSIPATIPSDHAGRTTDQCPTCHVEGGAAPAIPEDHFVGGQVDKNRLQCYTCHLQEG